MPGPAFCGYCGARLAEDDAACPACGREVQRRDPLMEQLRAATQGEYDVLGLIGRGGMGAVYRARERGLDRLVALKVISENFASQPGMVRRFMREAQTLAKLGREPNIVTVHAVRDVGGLCFFSMELVDGISLSSLLASTGRLPYGVACLIVDQIGLALQQAHARGIVHRDVKPGNVMVDRAGTSLLTDFGIARVAGDDRLTGTGIMVGTEAYMSPEVLRGTEITAASDQYSLGVVAYEMLSGAPPFGRRFYDVMQRIGTAPPPLAETCPDCPPPLDAIVARMLEREPSARWGGLREVREALESVPRPPASQLARMLAELVAMAAGPAVDDVASVESPPTPSRARTPVSGPTSAAPFERSSAPSPVPRVAGMTRRSDPQALTSDMPVVASEPTPAGRPRLTWTTLGGRRAPLVALVVLALAVAAVALLATRR